VVVFTPLPAREEPAPRSADETGREAAIRVAFVRV
jgi:hypothetical protein